MKLTRQQQIFLGVGIVAVAVLIFWYYNKPVDTPKKDGYYPQPPRDKYLVDYLQRPAVSRQKIRFSVPSMELDGTNTEYKEM